MVQLLWKIAQRLLKVKTELPYDSTILLLGRYSKEVKVGSQRDICVTLCIAAVPSTAKRWKQPDVY